MTEAPWSVNRDTDGFASSGNEAIPPYHRLKNFELQVSMNMKRSTFN